MLILRDVFRGLRRQLQIRRGDDVGSASQLNPECVRPQRDHYCHIMPTVVSRISHVLGKREGLTTLVQRFRFDGGGVDAAAIATLLVTAPLTGAGSVFGSRPGEEAERTETIRRLKGFSPAPGFRFNVELMRQEGDAFVVRFSQPDRNVAYLEGDLLWVITDEPGGTVLEEQINTERAMESVSQSLGGHRFSLRRWLFFRLGHKQVMSGATKNLASLLDQQAI